MKKKVKKGRKLINNLVLENRFDSVRFNYYSDVYGDIFITDMLFAPGSVGDLLYIDLINLNHLWVREN